MASKIKRPQMPAAMSVAMNKAKATPKAPRSGGPTVKAGKLKNYKSIGR